MIVPALLTDKFDQMQQMLNACAMFTKFAQVDIMDGAFVASKSLSLEEVKRLRSSIETEAHLMVNDPLAWVDAFKKLGSTRILFHYEIKSNPEKIITEIKKQGLQAGIAVNPATSIDDFEVLVPHLDAVLFMSVVPGFYGATFIPEVLEKIKAFRRAYPTVTIGIDGGVKLANLKMIKDSGVNYACVGSALMKATDLAGTYAELTKVFHE